MRPRLATLPGGHDCGLSHAARRSVERGLHAFACFRRLHLCEERVEFAAQRLEAALAGASKILELVEGEQDCFRLVMPRDHHDPICRLLKHSTELVLRIRRRERRDLDFLTAAVTVSSDTPPAAEQANST